MNSGPSLIDQKGRLLPRFYDILGMNVLFVFTFHNHLMFVAVVIYMCILILTAIFL